MADNVKMIIDVKWVSADPDGETRCSICREIIYSKQIRIMVRAGAGEFLDTVPPLVLCSSCWQLAIDELK